MKKVATPTIRELRLSHLCELDKQSKGFIKKCSVLLNQFDRPSNKLPKINSLDITGISYKNAVLAIGLLNIAYSEGFEFDFSDKNYHTKNSNDVTLIDGSVTYSPVIARIGLDFNRSEGHSENIYMPGQLFYQALEEINELATNIKKLLLTFENDILKYKNSKLDLPANSYKYVFLKILYNHFDGASGFIKYEDLCELASKDIKFKNQTKENIREKIRKYLTSRTEGVLSHMYEKNKSIHTESNGRLLIETVRGKGIQFNNEV